MSTLKIIWSFLIIIPEIWEFVKSAQEREIEAAQKRREKKVRLNAAKRDMELINKAFKEKNENIVVDVFKGGL